MIYLVILALAAAAGLLWILYRRSPRLAGVVGIAGVAAIAAFAAVHGAASGGVVILVLAGVAWLVWYFLFSGRVRTATPVVRARITHIAFAAFFIAYTFGILAWLAAGLIASFTGSSRSFHERMHAYGGAPAIVMVSASDVAPFSIDGSRRIREMTLRASAQTTISFENEIADTETACAVVRCSAQDRARGFVAIEHNISLYRRSGEIVFRGTHTRPRVDATRPKWEQEPVTITETFVVPF